MLRVVLLCFIIVDNLLGDDIGGGSSHGVAYRSVCVGASYRAAGSE